MKYWSNYIAIVLFILVLTGCGVYSFTGASISPEVKTISIQYFPNKAPLIQPTLSQNLTDAMKDKFIGEANLDLVPENGDLELEGEIIGYSTMPTAIQGNEQAALNRLTITVKVEFINHFDEKQNFENTFSRFLDYESSINLADVEQVLNDGIVEQIVQDVCNKAVVNW